MSFLSKIYYISNMQEESLTQLMPTHSKILRATSKNAHDKGLPPNNSKLIINNKPIQDQN